MTTIDAAARRDLFNDDTFFLSEHNPQATADQRDLETQALALLDTPAIKQAVEVAMMRFDILAGPNVPAEARADADRRVREWAFGHVAMALDSDPNHPRILGNVLGPPHRWFGRDVPGTRGPGTGENADCHYGFAPLDPYSRFELVGKVQDPPISDCPLYVTGTISLAPNVAGLDWRDIRIDDDGTFTITLDREPANGRANHIQTTPDSHFLFFRDCRQHWREKPNAYRLRRLDAPLGPPQTDEDKIGLAVRYIIEDVAMMWFFRMSVASVDTNTVSKPAGAGPIGGMPTQATARGRLELAPDEAFVLTITSGGAKYWTLASYDWWVMSNDFGTRLTTLNNTQSKPNPDGSYTYVLAPTDPGVHNWIDTAGRCHTNFVHRWQQLPREAGAGLPSASGQRVKLGALADALPPGVPRVDADGRRRQLAEREQLFARRFEL